MSYNTEADYSNMTEGKILPFKIELDVLNCVLSPYPHEKQKFCYKITAVGNDDDLCTDLKSIVLGIDEKITASQLQNIAVAINGKSENVKFDKNKNDNVVLLHPDESTVHSGLKFEFTLSKTNDIMIISFELSEAYEVGSMPLYLYGDDAEKTGLSIGGPKSKPDDDKDDDKDGDKYDDQGDDKDSDKYDGKDDDKDEYGEHGVWFDTPICHEVSCSVFDIYVPVSIKPYAHVYKPEVTCLGKAEILSGCRQCYKEFESCDFTITEQLSVRVPVNYGISTYYDNICIDCEEPNVEHTYKR